MKAVFASLVSAALCARLVAAHGIVTSITIDGKSYDGNTASVDASPAKDSPIRRVSDDGPITDENDPELSCGLNSEKASMVVDAMPGSKLSVQWSPWPHPVGPIMFYMASCGSTSCDQFDATGAKWFKIAQQGQKEGDPSQWYQADIMAGKPAQTTLPENLAPGGYLIRHELINLELAQSPGGAEYYPSCIQVKIGGNGNGAPDSTVSFPGAYHADDPGLYVPKIFDNVPGFKYQFPGGPVAKISGGGGGGGGAPAPSESSTDDGEAAPTQTIMDASSTDDAGPPATAAPPTLSSSVAPPSSSMAAPSPTFSSAGDAYPSMATPDSPTVVSSMATSASSMATPASSPVAPSPTTTETMAPSSVAAPSPTATYWVYVPPASSTVVAMSSGTADMQKRSNQFAGGVVRHKRMRKVLRPQ